MQQDIVSDFGNSNRYPMSLATCTYNLITLVARCRCLSSGRCCRNVWKNRLWVVCYSSLYRLQITLRRVCWSIRVFNIRWIRPPNPASVADQGYWQVCAATDKNIGCMSACWNDTALRSIIHTYTCAHLCVSSTWFALHGHWPCCDWTSLGLHLIILIV